VYRWDKQPVPVPATFTFSILNSFSEKSFVVDVNEKRMFGHAPGNSKVSPPPPQTLFNVTSRGIWGISHLVWKSL
jgi:hypothetical protein